jgi:hypothetical protein
MEILVLGLVIRDIVLLAWGHLARDREHGDPEHTYARLALICRPQASFTHSEREILRISQSLSIFSVSISSIETEYRTIPDSFLVHNIIVSFETTPQNYWGVRNHP